MNKKKEWKIEVRCFIPTIKAMKRGFNKIKNLPNPKVIPVMDDYGNLIGYKEIGRKEE
jgi:hypothetical protein